MGNHLQYRLRSLMLLVTWFATGLALTRAAIATSVGIGAGALSAVVLLLTVAVTAGAQFLADRLARLCGAFRGPFKQLLLGVGRLIAVEKDLLQQFRAQVR